MTADSGTPEDRQPVTFDEFGNVWRWPPDQRAVFVRTASPNDGSGSP